jgi:AGCS family alanine or glycine:cation symporter
LAATLLTTVGPSTALAQESTGGAEGATTSAAEPAAAKHESVLNHALGEFNGWVATVLFFSVTGNTFDIPEIDRDGEPVLDEHGKQKERGVGFPFIVFVLVAGGVFFSFFYRFINVRAIRHAIDIVRGKFDREEDAGDVSHFRALTSALSATVGLGNIAGVAIAIQMGGPGAVLWMMIAAFFGMSLKFNSCTLAQMFRRTNLDGSVSGGPMYYLDLGLRQVGGDGSPLAMAGKALAFVYALMIMGGSFGGGNMFQANQSFSAVASSFDVSPDGASTFGIVLAVLVGLVIIGGIQRIGAATARIVPAMVSIYVVASLYVIFANVSRVPETLGLIFSMAFSESAAFGGVVGVLVMGFQRASFSNEAGIGSAAVAHAAAKTDQPVREGMVAMLEPVIDTMLVCLMTALVVIMSGAWNDPALIDLGGDLKGVQLTAAAFSTEISWFPYVLTGCVLLFAYSTMISWAYYGERGWIYIVDHLGPGAGQRSLIGYRLIFVVFVYVGAVTKPGHVLNFSDYMILCMAFPNILGGVILAPTVKRALTKYWQSFQKGEFTPGALADRGRKPAATPPA